MKELYNAVRDVVKSIPGIKWFDWDYDQLSAKEPPVAYPCALFSLVDIPVSDGGKSNLFDVTFRIRYAERVYEKANNTTDEQYKDQALLHLDRAMLLANAVQDIDTVYVNRPQLVNIRSVNKVDPRIYELTFSVLMEEYFESETIDKPIMHLSSQPPMELEVDVVPPVQGD